jgi:uncharacterized protein (TIRG00374 family)
MRGALKWIALAAVVSFLAWKLATLHFDWVGFITSIRKANVGLLLLGCALIYLNNFIRALRWAVFLRPAYKTAGRKPLAWWHLAGAQCVGFTGLAIFGRLGELIRPLLVSRRTGFSFSSQIAVVAVERVFDLGAFAAIFSLNLLLAPGLEHLPYHELFHRVGYAVAALTMILGAFVVGIRLAGVTVARLTARVVATLSQTAAEAASDKILAFREGLDVIDTVGDFLLLALLSLAVWIVVALAYVAVLKAFPAPVQSLSIPDALLILGFSVVGNVVQLPGIGGGSQLLVIGALTKLFAMPPELATSAGLMIWLVGSIAIVPAGLIYARIEGISIRQTARTSEEAETG